jgi:hypothetical protein
VRENTERVRALHEALDRDDVAAVRRLAHALKGSTANIGACRLSMRSATAGGTASPRSRPSSIGSSRAWPRGSGWSGPPRLATPRARP